MKAPNILEPKPFKTFRDKYLAVTLMAAALLITSVASAQSDSTKYSQINGYGFKYKRMAFDSVLMIPTSLSPHTPYRAGALRYRASDSTLQIYTGYQWASIITGIGNGVDTAYMINDTILTIETPDEDFFLQVSKRHVDSIYRKSGQDSIFYRIAGVERAIKDSSGSSITLTNIGTGYALVATPNGSIKRLSPGYGVLFDSTAVANSIRTSVDTSSTNHVITQSDLNDAVRGLTAAGDTVVSLKRSAGVISDANIGDGSTTFGTDNTTAVQAVLDLASHTKGLYLIWDVRISTTGLRIGPNTYIKALPSYGAILRNNSDKPLFRNRDTAFAREPVDSNIIVEGGIWNGNSYNSGLNPAQAVGTPSNGTTAVFSFYGVRNLIVRDFTILRQRTYAIAGNNIRNGLYENGIIDAGNGGIFSDGVHFDGYSEHCTARNLKIKAIDDAVGINADDAYDNPSSPVYGYFPLGAGGPVNDINIENIHLDGGQFGVRVMSGSSRVDNIKIRNLTGSTIGYAVLIDNFWQDTSVIVHSGPGNMGNVQVENVNVDITGLPGFSINAAMISVSANVDNLILKDLKRYSYTYPGLPTLYVKGSYYNIKSIIVDGYDAIDTSSTQIEHFLVDGVTINNFIIQRAKVRRLNQGDGLMGANNATINNLQMNNIILDSVNYAYYNSSSTITNLNISTVYHKSRLFGTYSTIHNPLGTVSNVTFSNYTGGSPTFGTIATKLGDAFPASTTQPGYVNTTTQSFAGNKEFTGRALFTGALQVPVPIENGSINAYTSGSSSNDALKIVGNSDGANFGIQNMSSVGYIGFELIDYLGVTKVFTGFNRSSNQEFRINNLASGGYNTFYADGAERVRINSSGMNVTGQATVTDDAYNATTWNGNNEVPTKNALRDKLETMVSSVNAQTGAVTISAGTAITTSTLSGDITIAYNRTSSDVPHTIATYLSDVNNSGTSETDLYNTTIGANKLISNGQSIHFVGTVSENDITATTQIRVYFAGTEVANTGGISISGTGYLRIAGEIIRTTSTTARASFKVEGNGLTTDYVNEFDLTSLDFTTTNVFKVTGTAGGGSGGSNDITAKSGKLTFQSN